jgi:hypothetical protein
VCHHSISGGDANFLSHKTHKSAVEKSTKKKPAAITNFFKPQPTATDSALAVDASSYRNQSNIKKMVIDVDALPALPVLDPAQLGSTLEPGSSYSRSICQAAAQPTLLSRLNALVASLPVSIPIGKRDEPLACFATNPQDLVLPSQDAWEDVIDPTFNCVVGFGKSTPEIAALIQCGKYGMDGFCKWTTACIKQLGIPLSVLEMRLERVMQAMVLMCV